ncbi:putative DNA-directed RNA polymerases I and III subunit RPAC2 [Astathelohania contejeani]|uniref:DNA-directed RNA polymerases I and III subunit RPAC2 n=1 Tax=Astathelohania contejeani TaxID=164912 RepID=A0ABQ7I199_9MICR|nr:putative DNA-directed RNA polymerases I and III subunit RPAC2 [Thelohania contejeani]
MNEDDSVMEDSEKRVNITSNYMVEFKYEGHTIMNLLRWAISMNFTGEEVDLCGYTIPHPTDQTSSLRIQFKDEDKQNPENLVKKITEGLECIELIGKKLLEDLK